LAAVADSARDRAMRSVVNACYSAGGDLDTTRAKLLYALRNMMPFDAAFVASADPETLLFTGMFADDALAPSGTLFLDNEFAERADVNRFVDLAHARDPVASLDEVTKGDRLASGRWRDVIAPLGMGDELRAALRVDGTVWGFLCLHRSGPTGFDTREMNLMRQVAPHIGEAFRRAVVRTIATGAVTEQSQAVVLVADRIVLAVGGSVEDLDIEPIVVGAPLPPALASVVARLELLESSTDFAELPPACVRIVTKRGGLVAVHAARLRDASGDGPVALTLTPAVPTERASLFLAAYGLTPAQRRVASLVLQGRSTGQIVVELRISAHTVQDHLKAVFDKVGVRSRRELVIALMSR
jgi:DNA-binding CsgD family transcriptional regulator